MENVILFLLECLRYYAIAGCFVALSELLYEPQVWLETSAYFNQEIPGLSPPVISLLMLLIMAATWPRPVYNAILLISDRLNGSNEEDYDDRDPWAI